MWFNIIKKEIPTEVPDGEWRQYFMGLIQDVTTHIRNLDKMPIDFRHAFAGSIIDVDKPIEFTNLDDLNLYVDKLRQEGLVMIGYWDESPTKEYEEYFDVWYDLAVESDAPDKLIEQLELFDRGLKEGIPFWLYSTADIERYMGYNR